MLLRRTNSLPESYKKSRRNWRDFLLTLPGKKQQTCVAIRFQFMPHSTTISWFHFKITKSLGLLSLLLAAASMGCKKNSVDASLPAAQLLNQHYGTAPAQTADIYLPSGRNASTTQVTIFLHGGGWISGDKSDINSLVTAIQAANPQMAFLSINYTLADGTSTTMHPAQMNDIKKAIAYVKSNAANWMVSEKISLAGISAGAHLALLYAYNYDTAKTVKSVSSIVGPTDLTDNFYAKNAYFQSWFKLYIGKTYNEDSLLFKNLSPALQVKASVPPTFMAYGAQDPLVPVSNYTLLKASLARAGVAYADTLYQLEGHEFSTPAMAATMHAMFAFMKQQVK